MFIIREYTSSDIEAITELMSDLDHPASKPQMQKRMEIISSNPMYLTLVAELDGIVIGMIGLRQLYGYEYDHPVIQISALVTKAEYRGLGIGQALMKQAEAWAQECGASTLVLTSGNRPEREGAHQFYQRLGYSITGSRFTKTL